MHQSRSSVAVAPDNSMTTYKLEMLPDSSYQWRLLELRPRKGTRGGLRYVCIAIGTGRTNMERLETELTMKRRSK